MKATVSQSTSTEKPWLFYGTHYLWKKTHSTNNICKQRRSPKNREALNVWILICEITRQWHAASVTPRTHEINEYKQNRLPLETSSAKFSATTNFLFSLSSLHTLNKGIFHDIKTTTTEKPTWNRQEQWPVNAVHVQFSTVHFYLAKIQYNTTIHIGIVRLQGSPEETRRLYEAWAPQSKRDKQNKMIFAEWYVKNRNQTD